MTTIAEQLVIDDIFYTKNIIRDNPIFIDHYIPMTYQSLSDSERYDKLSSGFCQAAKESLIIDNAGGASEKSEAISINYFFERFKATNFLLEMQIEYWMTNYNMCDFICSINDERVGVSVTRAMGFPKPSDFTEERAYILLKKKMHGLIVARSGVCTKHEFNMSVLHIWCQTQRIADILKNVYPQMIFEDNSNTIHEVILLLTVCDTEYIYTNKIPNKDNK